MMKRIVFMMVILTVLSVTSMAGATPVQLKEVGVVPGTPVNIHAGAIGDINGAQAGNYQIQFTNSNGPTVSGFCVDPRYALSGFNSYDLLPIVAGTSYAAAAWVLDQKYQGYQATVAQIAVWELVWDWRTLNWDDGIFRLLNTTTNYATLETDAEGIYKAALYAFDHDGISADLLSKYRVASNGGFGAGGQDYIVPVPVPPSAILLCSGLLGLAGIRRNFKKQVY
jgi:hypothetical protein